MSDNRHGLENPDDTQTATMEPSPFPVIELDDGLFPNFFIDFANMTGQFNSWLDYLKAGEKAGMDPAPAIISDPPKSGKSMFISRVAPRLIKKHDDTALVFPVDFMQILRPENIGLDTFSVFATSLARRAIDWCKDNQIPIPTCATHGGVHLAPAQNLLDIFDHLNQQGRKIYLLWDEVQVWFELSSDSAAPLFDMITFHRKYKFLRFFVTGSAMLAIYRNILKMRSNGNYWPSAARTLSTGTEIDYECLAAFTFKLISERYPDLTPPSLLRFALENTPAMLCYFVGIHRSAEDGNAAMRKTNKAVADKLYHDFETDMAKLLTELHTGEPALFKLLLNLGFGLADFEDEDGLSEQLGRWNNIFRSLISHNKNTGFWCLRGYYGELFARSTNHIGEWKTPKLLTYPVPRYFAVIDMLHGGLEKANVSERNAAESKSAQLFQSKSVHIIPLHQNPSYSKLWRSSQPSATTGGPPVYSKETPHLEYFRAIRHAVSHVRSPQNVRDTIQELPPFIEIWCRDIYVLLFK